MPATVSTIGQRAPLKLVAVHVTWAPITTSSPFPPRGFRRRPIGPTSFVAPAWLLDVPDLG